MKTSANQKPSRKTEDAQKRRLQRMVSPMTMRAVVAYHLIEIAKALLKEEERPCLIDHSTIQRGLKCPGCLKTPRPNRANVEASEPPTRDVNRDSGTGCAHGGSLR